MRRVVSGTERGDLRGWNPEGSRDAPLRAECRARRVGAFKPRTELIIDLAAMKASAAAGACGVGRGVSMQGVCRAQHARYSMR